MMRICIFTKPPSPGSSKTRLASVVGDERAADLARAFLADTWADVAALDWATPVLAVTEPFDHRLSTTPWVQPTGDLGARIEAILARALGDAGAAIALGTDTPGLPSRLLKQARDALTDHDAVLGPAADGGFYLLGLRRCPAGLLQGLPWSSDQTYAATRQRLADHQLSCAELPPWFDIDRPEDLRRFYSLADAGEIVAPQTLALLRRLKR